MEVSPLSGRIFGQQIADLLREFGSLDKLRICQCTWKTFRLLVDVLIDESPTSLGGFEARVGWGNLRNVGNSHFMG